MLKYRINDRDFWNSKNQVELESYEVTQLFGDIADEKELLNCYYKDANISLQPGGKLLLKSEYNPYDADGNSGHTQTYEFVDTVEISGVNAADCMFTVEIDKNYALTPSSVSLQTITLSGVSSRYVYFYFTDSHYFTDPSTVTDDEADDIVVTLVYDGGSNMVDLTCEYVTSTSLRIAMSDFQSAAGESLCRKLFGYASLDSAEDMVADTSLVTFRRKRFRFTDRDDFAFYYDRPLQRIPLPLEQSFDTNMYQSDALETDFADVEKEKALNRIVDLEKDVYSPVISNNGAFDPVYKITFNLHFREHRGDDWLVRSDSYWNGTYLDSTKKDGDGSNGCLQLMDDNASEDNTMSFFSEVDAGSKGEEKEWKKSNQSDLLSYLGFTNTDVRYQKNKVKKTFLRLSFYDSMNESDHNLLGYSTVFLNSGKLFSKYVRHFEDETYSYITYDTDSGKYEDTLHGMTGIRVNREPSVSLVKEYNGDNEELRLSSQFVVEDKFSSSNSSEGFYVYLWKDNHSALPQDLYMKVEFDHAGYGRSLPMMMPYVKKGETVYTDVSSEDGEVASSSYVKTFKQIVADQNKPTNGYGMMKYLRYSYIHLKYQYDKDNDAHVYFVDPDEYGNLSDNLAKDNELVFDLYEARLSDHPKTKDTTTDDSDVPDVDEPTIVRYGDIVISGTLSYPNIAASGGYSDASLNGLTVKQKVYYSDGTSVDKTLGSGEYTKKYTDRKGYVDSTSGRVTYEEKNNSQSEVTVDTVTLTVTANGKNKAITADVKQDALTISPSDYTFTATPTSVNFGENGGDSEITVVSTLDGEDVNYDSNTHSIGGWLTIKVYSDKVTLTAAQNTDIARSTSFTLTQSGSGKTITINVTQDATTARDIFAIDPSTIYFTATGSPCSESGEVISMVTPTVNSLLNGAATPFSMEKKTYTWCKVTLDGNSVKVTNVDGTYDDRVNDRSVTVTFTQEETGDTKFLKIVQLPKTLDYTFRFVDITDIVRTENLAAAAAEMTKTYAIESVDSEGNAVDFISNVGGTTEHDVVSGDTITAKAVKGRYEYTFTYTKNEGEADRTDEIVLTQSDSGRTLTIDITQAFNSVTYTFCFDDETKDMTIMLPYQAGTYDVHIMSKGENSDGSTYSIDFTKEYLDPLAVFSEVIVSSETATDSNYKFHFRYAANTDVDERNITDVTFTQNETGDTIKLHVKQYGDGTVVIPNFDYLVTRYYWTSDDGTDLDSLTFFTNTTLKTDKGVTIDNRTVGYLGSAPGVTEDITYNGKTQSKSCSTIYDGTDGKDLTQCYLKHGGDNTSSGNESCLINFNKLCSEENLLAMKKAGVTDIELKIYGNWWGTRNSGDCDIEFCAYKGGTMSRETDNSYNFINTGGTTVYSERHSTNTWADSGSNSGNTNYYTYLARLVYNISSKNAALYMIKDPSGRQEVGYGYLRARTNGEKSTDDDDNEVDIGVWVAANTYGNYYLVDEYTYGTYKVYPSTITLSPDVQNEHLFIYKVYTAVTNGTITVAAEKYGVTLTDITIQSSVGGVVTISDNGDYGQKIVLSAITDETCDVTIAAKFNGSSTTIRIVGASTYNS